jgi:tetratricopeptide (TPR) repeat protein
MTLVFAEVTMAGSVKDLVQQGNKLYNKGNFNDALREYDQALVDQPQATEPKFNKANCYFQLDDLDQAINLYNEVAAESKDMELVEKAKYNLGNCYFQQGSKQKDSNLQKALEDLQASIVYWRSALEINPENEKAAKNIEVARLIIKDIIDQINEQQQQAEKQKQLQQQLKELAEQQKALAQKTQQTKKDADQGQISPQQAEDGYKQQAQEQSQLKAKTEQALQQIEQQDPNNPLSQQMRQAGSELEQAVDAQSNSETQLKDSEPDAAKKSQDKAVEHLENALKELSGGGQQNQEQQQEQQGQTQQPQEPNQPDQEQQQMEQKTSVVPDATAQEILDKEQQEKKQRQILQQGGYQKVEKDW